MHELTLCKRNYRLKKRPRREDANVDQKLERLKEQLLTKLGARDSSSPLLPTLSPFVKRVQQETIPKKFMMPTMAAYDRMGNPQEHVLNYKTFMELQTHSDVLMCKVFPTTLTGSDWAWFNNLELGSIQNLINLASVFISRFIIGVSAERKMSYLKTVCQRRNESLREYVAIFNSKALQIPELDERRLGDRERSRGEEDKRQDRLERRLDRGPETLNRSRGEEDKRQDRLERRLDRGLETLNKHRWEIKEQRPYQLRLPAEVTLLNVSKDEVLLAVQDKDFVQGPKPMKADASRMDLDKYCQYHRTRGHDMNDCY
ncbi:uncharacterized protein LOC110602053 [Manihot esculenta]|uniref:uncharacterized protein LOC110602053 n=1 Tax=Manihot esculenta TaxID=3983 RepID=UPI000B5D46B8|nr:uncharacterized protein LOC110602053 [Manihot esculenta]